jgi:transposase-like protein
MTKPSPFKYFKTSPEIIRLAVMLYIRFSLSLRNVEDLLHERGVDVSHEAVRFWWHRFGPMFAAEIRQRRIHGMRSSHWRWHLDEMFVKINGEKHYLWRAVDHEGEVLESFVTKTRDKKAALKFLRKTMKKHGRADVLVTDKLRSYGAALRDLGAADRRRPDAGSTTGRRTPTSRSDDESGRCSGSGACEVCSCSPPSTPPSRTISTPSAASPAETSSRPTAPPLSLSGAVSARHNGQRRCPY